MSAVQKTKKYVQQEVGIWYRPNKYPAFSQITADIFQHALCFLPRLKSVVHTELHGNHIERLTSEMYAVVVLVGWIYTKLIRPKCLSQRVGIAIQRGKRRSKFWPMERLPS